RRVPVHHPRRCSSFCSQTGRSGPRGRTGACWVPADTHGLLLAGAFAVAPGSYFASDAFTAPASGRVNHGTVFTIVAGIPDGKTTARPGGIAARADTSRMLCRWVFRLVTRVP